MRCYILTVATHCNYCQRVERWSALVELVPLSAGSSHCQLQYCEHHICNGTAGKSNNVLKSAIPPGINKTSEYSICMYTLVYGVCNTCCWVHVENCSSRVTYVHVCTHWNSTLWNYVLQPQLHSTPPIKEMQLNTGLTTTSHCHNTLHWIHRYRYTPLST